MSGPEGFRAEALAFLEQHAERRTAESAGSERGSDRVGLLDERTPEEDELMLDAAKGWRRKVFDAGLGWISGPEQFGGRGLEPEYERLWWECESKFATPSKIPFAVSLGMVAPTVLAHGTDTVRAAYLKRLYRGEMIACQLFSEPGAGSDLASVSTRAERDGDHWRVSGQKVWTSGAHYSDIGEVLCRTDAAKPKHQGLTMFLMDMRAPGVEVRPLRQMTGGAAFNEVFLTDVRVPDDHRLGDLDGGWAVALTTLMNERSAVGSEGRSAINLGLERMLDVVRRSGRDADPALRQQLADIYIHETVDRLLQQSLASRVPAGAAPGPEMSLTKLSLVQHLQRVSAFLGDALGPALVADTGAWGTYAWSEFVLGVPGVRIGGGTDEIMRNIVSERVLGLPKEPTKAKP